MRENKAVLQMKGKRLCVGNHNLFSPDCPTGLEDNYSIMKSKGKYRERRQRTHGEIQRVNNEEEENSRKKGKRKEKQKRDQCACPGVAGCQEFLQSHINIPRSQITKVHSFALCDLIGCIL